MEERDYNNFDYMQIIVNEDFFDEVCTSYMAFGWEIVSASEEKIFSNARDVLLKRPHKLKHKDELQRLQVHLEFGFNDLTKIEAAKYQKSIVLGLSVGMLLMAIIGYFLNFAITAEFFAGMVSGYVVCALAALAAVFLLFSIAKLKKYEEAVFERKKEEIKAEMTKYCLKSKEILENDND